MTDDELCGILRGPDAKYFASKAADRIGELNQRPDASAGLIEALEQALDCIRGETPEDMSHEEARQDTIDKIRRALRARAADRSGK